jgi:N-acetylneuraminic acid mutarotase
VPHERTSFGISIRGANDARGSATASLHQAKLGAVPLVLAIGLPMLSAGEATWRPTPTAGAQQARYQHMAVSTGSKMIVWGGVVGFCTTSGGIYDPVSDTWTATSAIAPTARQEHTAVWTGSRMIIWGGADATSAYIASGSIYDPVSDKWTATTNAVAPTGRQQHTAVWTGSKMIVWGGLDAVGFLNTGGVYDPATDAWVQTNPIGAPVARSSHTAIWTGRDMIIWGGVRYAPPGVFEYVNTGASYSRPGESFFTLTPCRLVDTRNADGPALAPNSTRSFSVTGGVCPPCQ